MLNCTSRGGQTEYHTALSLKASLENSYLIYLTHKSHIQCDSPGREPPSLFPSEYAIRMLLTQHLPLHFLEPLLVEHCYESSCICLSACYQCDAFQSQPKAFLPDRAVASSGVPGLSHGRHRPRAAFPSFSPAPPYSKLQQALKKVNCWLDRSKDRYRQLKSINKHVRNLSLETHLHRTGHN